MFILFPALVFVLLVLVTVLMSSGCSDKSKTVSPAAAPAVEVSVVTLETRKVPMTVELPGRTAAFSTAEIRPQVGGILRKRLLVEGSEVRAAQLLYQFDPAAAKAAVASARSVLASAAERAARYRELVAIEAVSRESADEAQASFEQAQDLHI